VHELSLIVSVTAKSVYKYYAWFINMRKRGGTRSEMPKATEELLGEAR